MMMPRSSLKLVAVVKLLGDNDEEAMDRSGGIYEMELRQHSLQCIFSVSLIR